MEHYYSTLKMEIISPFLLFTCYSGFHVPPAVQIKLQQEPAPDTTTHILNITTRHGKGFKQFTIEDGLQNNFAEKPLHSDERLKSESTGTNGQKMNNSWCNIARIEATSNEFTADI